MPSQQSLHTPTQEMDAATQIAAALQWCTSNVRAGKIFGTQFALSRSYLFSIWYDYDAFKAYALTLAGLCIPCRYHDTLKIGVPNAIRVAKELGDKINFCVRLIQVT